MAKVQVPVKVLDGGLATQLESRGHVLSDALWSARLLRDAPDDIQAVHMDFLQAGADIISTASYQATLPGFMKLGLSKSEAIDLIAQSVQLARDVRDRFWNEPGRRNDRQRPLVAASIGPYGAFLANGAEYTGDYDLNQSELLDFHRDRWHVLGKQSPDIMICETTPSFEEAQVYGQLASETKIPVWISFSCRDQDHISDGTPLAKCAKWADQHAAISAVGANCLSPFWGQHIVQTIQSNAKHIQVLIYPNSGEIWHNRKWQGESCLDQFVELANDWIESGASIIGGCCRTTPEHVGGLRQLIIETERSK